MIRPKTRESRYRQKYACNEGISIFCEDYELPEFPECVLHVFFPTSVWLFGHPSAPGSDRRRTPVGISSSPGKPRIRPYAPPCASITGDSTAIPREKPREKTVERKNHHPTHSPPLAFFRSATQFGMHSSSSPLLYGCAVIALVRPAVSLYKIGSVSGCSTRLDIDI